jgi:dipeptidyl aminopeptidase/acylaminoacyl peptidase
MSTPTLLMAGSLDDCTPPSQATEFYNAARDAGVPTALVIDPEEGHGVADFPALLDYTARILDWLVRHVPPDGWSPDHHHEPRRAS